MCSSSLAAKVLAPRKDKEAISSRLLKMSSIPPNELIKVLAVTSPTPGMPGILSELSPFNAKKSII